MPKSFCFDFGFFLSDWPLSESSSHSCISLREPLELFEACEDLNAPGGGVGGWISCRYKHAVHIMKLTPNGAGFSFLHG